MKFRKVLSIFMALILIMSLSACSGTAPMRNPSASTASVSGKDSKTAPVTLKYYTIGTPDSDLEKVNKALNELLEKKINVRIDYNKINWSDYGHILSNIINSGTNFDIAFATEGDQGDYSGNAVKGVWLALDPYLSTTGREMHAAIDPLLWEGVKINEKIYGVPTNKEVAVPEWWMYSKELIDRYDIDISKYSTLESLEPLFKLIKQNEPDYTVIELDQYSHNFFALESYEYVLNKDIPLMVKSTDKSLKIVNIFETETAKKTLSMLRKFYKSGYINEDAAVKLISGLEKDLKVFWREGGGGPYSTSSWSKDTGYEVVAHQVSPSIVTTESARGGIMVVNSRTKYPQECISFLNCLNTDPEVRNLINFGIEGEHYALTPQGQVEVKKDSGYTGVQYTQGNWFILKTLKGDPRNKWDVYKNFNSESIKSEALDFTPDVSGAAVSTRLSAVSKVTAKYYPGLMTGTVDPEKVLPMFINELKAAGIDELKNSLQQQIDEWKAKKSAVLKLN
ncbi:ABC transporter substrate-binding protein [Ruminiclostridium cellobioparum]|uniref:ABC-type sugar transport system, periplasmic component n=1 Tax=Ruminiclostridium cellobioparum subsp. termitidis CT1112 TaxID=1195236 RepID=S0FV18_RUMCE|nr:ABC transporter substrate-binding protein [Ruminiclostridium cellobioparum]EMS74136.1 ABC-type sugar transport system, periplasmic component [Ruminiclostridium cellobioparum subsp. termitidis CT1112]